MKYKFFKIPVRESDLKEEELNKFLSANRIVSVYKDFVQDKQDSFWSYSVEYIEGNGLKPSEKMNYNKKRIDYKEILSNEEFILFSKLRDIRKELASKENIPQYLIFTNEQLSQMVKKKVLTIAEIIKINGIGEKRAKQYGEEMLKVLKEENEKNK